MNNVYLEKIAQWHSIYKGVDFNSMTNEVRYSSSAAKHLERGSDLATLIPTTGAGTVLGGTLGVAIGRLKAERHGLTKGKAAKAIVSSLGKGSVAGAVAGLGIGGASLHKLRKTRGDNLSPYSKLAIWGEVRNKLPNTTHISSFKLHNDK